jgi:DNA-binding transcriptional LysR family regulator
MDLRDRIGRRMKLHDLHVLMAVAQAGSMSKAAVLLNTTQPAVSKSIADLEHAIGRRLLDRSRHGVDPTEYGRALLAGGVAVFDDLRQAVKSIEALADATVGDVRVGTHDPMIAGLLPAIVDRLHRMYPGISLHVIPAPTDAHRLRVLRERRVDLLIGRIPPATEEDIQADVLFRDRAVVVASTDSKWARRRKVQLAQLTDESWCLPSTDSEIGIRIADAFRADGVTFPPKRVVWSAGGFWCSLLPRGPYLAISTASLIRFGLSLPPLKVLPVDLRISAWPAGVMTLKNRTLTSATKLLIDCAREVVKPLVNKN